MDTDRIKQIRKGKEKAAQRKYDNFQASGDVLLFGRKHGICREV